MRALTRRTYVPFSLDIARPRGREKKSVRPIPVPGQRPIDNAPGHRRRYTVHGTRRTVHGAQPEVRSPLELELELELELDPEPEPEVLPDIHREPTREQSGIRRER